MLETTLDPLALLQSSRRSKTRFGRVRTVRWGERTLDLDLLLFGDRIIETPELTVPHPRMAVRRFVLEPLAEIAPRPSIRSRSGRSSSLLADLDRRAETSEISQLVPLSLAMARLYHSFTHRPHRPG